MNMKIRHFVIPALAAVVILVGGLAVYQSVLSPDGQSTADISPAAGGEGLTGTDNAGAGNDALGTSFTLVDHNGNTVTDQGFLGGHKLVFFGFTHCPDVCPAGLKKIAKTYELLNQPDDQLHTLFITVDPERDTPDVMKEYVAMFHPDITGLTGSRAQIDKTINEFKVYASKAETMDGHEGHYMMNHSAYIYLLNPENEAVEFFGSGDSAADIADTLRPVLED